MADESTVAATGTAATGSATTNARDAASTTAATTTTGAATGTANSNGTAPATVTLTAEQYQSFAALQAQLTQERAERQQRDDAARQAQVDAMARQGEIDRALRETREDAERRVNIERTQLAAESARGRRYAIDNDLTRALVVHPLRPHAAEQLAQLWRGQFTAEPNGDTYNVRTPGGQTPADFIAAQLASPAYSHFLFPTTQGGTGGSTGAQQTTISASTTTAVEAPPKTLGEAVIRHMQAVEKARPTDARIDMSSSMGLRRPAKS